MQKTKAPKTQHKDAKTMFLLGDEAREEAKKSIKGLVAHAKASDEDHHSALYLVINTKIHLVKENDHTPRIIPLTHKLHKIDERTICLITNDPVNFYKDELQKKGSPTEDLFRQIISFTKAKSFGHSKKALVRLYKENEVILADARIYKKLPDVLGPQFYARNKKVPYIIQMAKPEPGIRTHGKRELRVDPKYVRNQVKAITGNTSYIPPAGGFCFHVVVGYTDWKTSEILTNINDVISYFVDEKYKPVGGLLGKLSNLHSVLIRTSDSIAMPVMKKKEEAAEEDESGSEFDFE
ncbi:hypothetical protein ACI3LY_002438 [Candidozyma auris]|uniref:Ribosomal protein L1 n=2 Tax=Candidozyma auris TaxID=498019 RepID=A0A2H0ZS41_CANAR|nr:hypothetical_protein [[Candida] auris]KND98054.2 hypothetical protein QG37_05291 [[Candida] auris]PIS51544.1 hypothetical protein B9J08_003135 [[Candida] auris]PIS53529.1 hypothetical protein CJI97_003207 [[Candida] auris]QEO20845.1 hypothetical_protein [[Candida] auris]QWW22100.1 hypothetical protein CA7LBN_000846 [[Candida] auris]